MQEYKFIVNKYNEIWVKFDYDNEEILISEKQLFKRKEEELKIICENFIKKDIDNLKKKHIKDNVFLEEKYYETKYKIIDYNFNTYSNKRELIKNFLDTYCNEYIEEYLLLMILEQILNEQNQISNSTIVNAFECIKNKDWIEDMLNDNIDFVIKENDYEDIKEAIEEIKGWNE